MFPVAVSFDIVRFAAPCVMVEALVVSALFVIWKGELVITLPEPAVAVFKLRCGDAPV